MAEQVLTSVYRTGEIPGVGFRNCYTLLYCFSHVEIKGLSGSFCRADHEELKAFFILKGIKECRFQRLKGGKMIEHFLYGGK
tara:strand:- start:465 stop:710 length:246 start_codon:yes stop_codon:yes gene_type:complete